MASYEKFQNNRLFILGGKLADIMILSLLWVLCSLPVVTMGASTSALYFTVVRCLREKKEDRLAKCFFRSFKSCLKQGIVTEIIYILYGAIVGFDIYIARNGIGGYTLPEFYKSVSYALVLPAAFTLPFIFPLIGRFSNDLKNVFKNSFLLCATHPLHTVLILLTVAAGGFLSVIFPPLLTVIPGLCALLCSFMIEPDFRRALGIEDEEETQEETEEEIETAEERFSRPGIYGSDDEEEEEDEEE